jgi:hypothetical protein
MFAAPIRIRAEIERHVGTIVGGEDRLRGIGEELGLHPFFGGEQLIVVGQLLEIVFHVQSLEAIRRTHGRSATDDGLRRPIIMRRCRHSGSSDECSISTAHIGAVCGEMSM